MVRSQIKMTLQGESTIFFSSLQRKEEPKKTTTKVKSIERKRANQNLPKKRWTKKLTAFLVKSFPHKKEARCRETPGRIVSFGVMNGRITEYSENGRAEFRGRTEILDKHFFSGVCLLALFLGAFQTFVCHHTRLYTTMTTVVWSIRS